MKQVNISQMSIIFMTTLFLLDLCIISTLAAAESPIPIINNIGGGGDSQVYPPTCTSCCPRAEQGPQGPSGIPGIPGPPGIPGNHGNNGNNGMSGTPGYKGSSGSRGLEGTKGDRGFPGPRGLPGFVGEPGPPGILALAASSQPGTPGVSSFQRDTKGNMGERGQPGDPGIPGLPGVPGEKGNLGPTGTQGPPGPPGLTAGAANLATTPRARCAFSAAQWMTQTARYGTVDIVFNYMLSNVGNSFNRDTGRFTCPVNGTYFFTFHIFTDEIQPVVQLVKNDEFQVSPNKASMSNTIILDLVEGDQVWLRLLRGSFLSGNRGRQTTFSGHLLFPDNE